MEQRKERDAKIMREKQEKKAAAAAEKAAKKWLFFPLNIQAFMPKLFWRLITEYKIQVWISTCKTKRVLY